MEFGFIFATEARDFSPLQRARMDPETFRLFHNYLLPYLLHTAYSHFRSYPVLSQSRNSSHCMESEGSLPHSQVPVTCPYPEPLIEDPSEYYPPIYASVSQVVSLH